MLLARGAVCLLLVGASPAASSAQHAAPVGATVAVARAGSRGLATSRPLVGELSRRERIGVGALLGAGAGALAAYLHTHYRSPAARSGGADVHEMDFVAYLLAMLAGAGLGALLAHLTAGDDSGYR